jgi:hypothetical protein
MNVDDGVEYLRVECNNYDQTVQAIKALAHELLWDDQGKALTPGGAAFVGRRMDTSPKNRVSPNTKVTPDLAVRASLDTAFVAEAKLALSASQEQRKKKILEVAKYDDDLVGWDTQDGRVRNHDIIIVVRHFHGKDVQQDIVELRQSGALVFERKLALVCFAIVEEAQTWMSLELLDGGLSDGNKDRKLRRRLAIALDHVAANPIFGHVMLYDAKPPQPWIMDRIHEVITSDLTPDEHLGLREEGAARKVVAVEDLRKNLSQSFGPGQPTDRTPEIPRQAWVEEAMDLFVKMGWATRQPRKRYIYTVKNRRAPFTQFLRVCAKDMMKKSEDKERLKKEMPLLREVIDKEDV